MSDHLPAPTGPLSGTVLEPTAVIPPPTAERPATPVVTPTVLIGARTVPTPQPEPGHRARDFAQQLTARRLRHAKRRARRAEERAAAPAEPTDDVLDEEPELQDEQPREPAAQRRRITYRRTQYGQPTRHRSLDQRQHGRLKTLLVTGTAAGIGWSTPAGHWSSQLLVTIGHADVAWAVSLGTAAIAAAAYLDFVLRGGQSQTGAIPVRDVTGWGLPFVIVARVPLATALLALGLYAPGRI